MVGTSTEVEIGIEILLAEAFDEEQACEHWRHDDPQQAFAHAGNAEWYVQTRCDGCGHSGGILAACDKYMQRVRAVPRLRCRSCRSLESVEILVQERIKQ